MRIVITAVPAREPSVRYLTHHLPKATVVWEEGRGAMDTFRRAWATHGNEPRLCLQDDVILCTDFMKRAKEVISARPEAVIQFFSMRKADYEGPRWDRGSRWLMNQCYYLPEGMAKKILDFSEIWPDIDKHPTADDMVMAAYFKSERISYFNQIPNLVDHAPVQSAIDSRRSKKRQSLTFTDPELTAYPKDVYP